MSTMLLRHCAAVVDVEFSACTVEVDDSGRDVRYCQLSLLQSTAEQCAPRKVRRRAPGYVAADQQRWLT